MELPPELIEAILIVDPNSIPALRLTCRQLAAFLNEKNTGKIVYEHLYRWLAYDLRKFSSNLLDPHAWKAHPLVIIFRLFLVYDRWPFSSFAIFHELKGGTYSSETDIPAHACLICRPRGEFHPALTESAVTVEYTTYQMWIVDKRTVRPSAIPSPMLMQIVCDACRASMIRHFFVNTRDADTAEALRWHASIACSTETTFNRQTKNFERVQTAGLLTLPVELIAMIIDISGNIPALRLTCQTLRALFVNKVVIARSIYAYHHRHLVKILRGRWKWVREDDYGGLSTPGDWSTHPFFLIVRSFFVHGRSAPHRFFVVNHMFCAPVSQSICSICGHQQQGQYGARQWSKLWVRDGSLKGKWAWVPIVVRDVCPACYSSLIQDFFVNTRNSRADEHARKWYALIDDSLIETAFDQTTRRFIRTTSFFL